MGNCARLGRGEAQDAGGQAWGPPGPDVVSRWGGRGAQGGASSLGMEDGEEDP